ncbi:hypothetical protein BDW71DRAFT_203164 [Aspergillus fruticulosus]
MSKRLPREAYTIGWIAPLPIEAAAALFQLDEHHAALESSTGQTIVHHIGRIHQHHVAIAGFPAGEVGIGPAARIATAMQRDFPHLEVPLLVGIATGIPSEENDIRLGDVAVAIPVDNNSGVMGYDTLKLSPEEIELKQWQNATDIGLRSAISAIRSLSLAGRSDFRAHLVRFNATLFQRPGTMPPPPIVSSKNNQRRLDDGPAVHYGCILSGNKVIRNAEERDRLRKEYNVVAIVMEAAGMMNILPVAVIRGISDFADEDKSDEWQHYAATTASAYARELLMVLPARRPQADLLSNMSAPTSRMRLADLYLLLDEKANQREETVDWRNTVNDLLKVPGLDISGPARARLASRWNVFVGTDGSAVRNIALHGLIMDELARCHGNVPEGLVQALSEG